MDHEVIIGPLMPPPMGHDSQAVRAGNLHFVAGQPGIDLRGSADPDSQGRVRARVETGVSESSRRLEAAGSGLEHVVKTTTFLTGLDNGEAANRLFAEYFPTNPPARSSPVVELLRGLLVYVEAIAAIT